MRTWKKLRAQFLKLVERLPKTFSLSLVANGFISQIHLGTNWPFGRISKNMEMTYYKTKETVEEYIRLAKDISGIDLIEKLKEVLLENSSLLEIGSGPGTDWNILKECYNVTGSDNSVEFLNYLRTENPNGSFIELNAATLKTNERFDGIYSNKVLHHLDGNELITSIEAQLKILNPNGIICHSFWKGEGSETFKGMFVNYHTALELRKLFEETFEIMLLEEYAEFEDRDSLLLIAKKR